MSDTRSALRREQVQLLIATVPVLIAGYFIAGAVGSFAARPWVVAVVLLPLLAVVVALGLPLVRERRVLLGGGFLPFFAAYCLLFSVAAGTRVLEVNRTSVQGFEAEAPSNVLGLGRLGDWHYWFAPRAPAARDLAVVLLPSFDGQLTEDARITELNLIAQAVRVGARGIAFDFTLDSASEVDGILCDQIQRAEAAGTPVIVAYDVLQQGNAVVRGNLAPQLRACIPEQRRGTALGLRQADMRVRMVPTSHLRDTTMRSLSMRIAAALSPGLRLPDEQLAQFVAPSEELLTLDGTPDETTEDLLRDRFVIVGASRADDVFDTPWGPRSGAVIHAYAAHAIRSNFLIHRLDMSWMLAGVFVLCYLLTLVQARGAGVRALWVAAALMAVAIMIAAALAMRVGLLWIDTSYPLLAVGTLSAALTGGARLQRGRVQTQRDVAALSSAAGPAGGTPSPVEPFDVFLSHNSADKPMVIALAEALRARGLRVWLDVWELVPGMPWQAAIEQAIIASKSAAVLVGKDGLGPWEEPEMRACLDECVRRRMAVIPVLLPDASAEPSLPLFLRQFTWVDLRGGITEAALDRLEWGVTGVKPRRR